MTDRTYHRAAAERLLDYADEWAAQVGEPTPEAGELSCLAWAAVHALLAIHDTLTDPKPEPVTATHPWTNPLTATHPWPPEPVPHADLSASEGENGAEERPDTDNPQNAILCPECDDHINTHNMEGCRRHRCDCPRTPEDVARALIAAAAKPTWCPKCGHHTDDHHDGRCVTLCECTWEANADG